MTNEFTAIRIDEGKFKNVIYAYNEIQVGEEEREDGGLDLNFTILEIKSDNDNHKIHEQEFHKVVGDILVLCLEKSMTKRIVLTSSTEITILSHLLTNENFSRKVLPFLKNEYFESKENKVIFDEIYNFYDKYNTPPTKESSYRGRKKK